MSSREYILNWGPHHPSTHGVLRLILDLSGEKVVSCEPDIGYLHRDIERLVETKKYISIIPFLDRLDYMSPSIQEHAFVLAIERVLGLEIPKRAEFIRVIIDELTRISSHIFAIGTASHDLGIMSLLLYSIEEREKVMEVFDDISGTRMHLNAYVPGGVAYDIAPSTFEKITRFINGLDRFYECVESLCLENTIFKARTKGIGVISKEIARASGISGVNLRASGIKFDVRTAGYGAYKELDFEPIVLDEGDAYSRTNLRYLEIKQSADLVMQCCNKISDGQINCFGPYSGLSGRFGVSEMVYASFYARGIELEQNSIIYTSTETPRGEFGVHMYVGTDKTKPYRLHFKSPSLQHIQLLKKIIPGCKLPDINAILGSLDFIMGCCDR